MFLPSVSIDTDGKNKARTMVYPKRKKVLIRGKWKMLAPTQQLKLSEFKTHNQNVLVSDEDEKNNKKRNTTK